MSGKSRPLVTRPMPDSAALAAFGDIDPVHARLFAMRGVTGPEQLDYGLARLAPIGKLENIDEDLATVCARIGVEHEPLGRVGSRPHADYRSYYDDATRDKVARHWARDIELFGYEFEGVAADAALPGR